MLVSPISFWNPAKYDCISVAFSEVSSSLIVVPSENCADMMETCLFKNHYPENNIESKSTKLNY